jgi:hypothetical protein
MRSGLDAAAGLPESERLVQLGPEGTDTPGGLTGEPNQPRHPMDSGEIDTTLRHHF